MDRVNHSQIARAAGVSRSTVSRALQNHPAISPEVRQKIQQMAERMHYRPNPLVSALMAARNHPRLSQGASTLALLTAWSDKTPRAITFQKLFRGIHNQAEKGGLHVEQFWFNHPHLSGRRLSDVLISRGIVAVLLGPLSRDQKPFRLDWEHFSLGYVTPHPNIPILHRASAFNFRSACMAVRKLLELGYRRPCLALHKHIADYVYEQWTGGFFAAVSCLPKREWISPYLCEHFDKDRLSAWCKTHRPDVILSNDSKIAHWLAEMKLPIAFASLDRHETDAGIAGIDQQSEKVGAAAVDIITAQLNRNERGIPDSPTNVLLEGMWIDGASAPGIHPKKPRASRRG